MFNCTNITNDLTAIRSRGNPLELLRLPKLSALLNKIMLTVCTKKTFEGLRCYYITTTTCISQNAKKAKKDENEKELKAQQRI